MIGNTQPAQPGLKRVLGLKELLLYGIILIQPTAPMPLFGVVAQEARGHVVTTILIGMVAMLFTAISYGRMANAYPSAGSAYAYVGRELHAALGYLVGWGMLFDYVMNPIICAIWCSKSAMKFLPMLPYAVWAVFFVGLFTAMNLRGIQASARTNAVIAAGLGVVIVLFFGAAARWLWLQPPAGAAGWLRPFYDPQTFSWQHVSTGASLAMLTYIGFDGISTLSEEVRNPRRNILLATVLTCLVTGVLASLQVYTAQLVWPETNNFPDVDTAFVDVAGKAGGQWLLVTVNAALLIATIGSGSGAHLGAGRLLYSMGRDNAIPRQFFGVVHPRTRIPRNSIHRRSAEVAGPARQRRRPAHHRLSTGRRAAELRRVHRLYGGQRFGFRALLRPRRAAHAGKSAAAAAGLCRVFLHMAEPAHARQGGGPDLADDRAPLRRLEDELVRAQNRIRRAGGRTGANIGRQQTTNEPP
jgi:putrescine importer